MRKNTYRHWAVLLSLLLCFGTLFYITVGQKGAAAEDEVQSVSYADNDTFRSVLQSCTGGKIILSEHVIWNSEKPAELITREPIEIELGDFGITVAEGCRLSFSGPFHFTGNKTLFYIDGELSLDGAELTAVGTGTTAIAFSDAPVAEDELTMGLDMKNTRLSVLGEEAVGFHMVQSANISVLNSVIACVGEKSVGVINEPDSIASISEQSQFEVMGKQAVGMVIAGEDSPLGDRVFHMAVCGENSRGILALRGSKYINEGTIEVSGAHAVGIELKDGAQRVQFGSIIVSGTESTGIFAEGKLEVAQLTLKAEVGKAAEAGGAMSMILCDIQATPDKLLSHTGEIVLDTCLISEPPMGAVIKTRKAQPYLNGYETPDSEFLAYDLGVFGFFVPVGPKKLILPEMLTFSLYDTQDAAIETIELSLPVIWEQTEYDADTVGDYEIAYRANTNCFPVEVSGSVTVHVYDVGKPWLAYAMRMGDTYTELYFTPKAEDTEVFRLWVSEDEGETWLDYIAEGVAQAWGTLGFVATDKLKENTSYLLKLEIVGGANAGISPVISYLRSEREIKWTNGDRDGGDQRPQKERPGTDSVPEPDHTPNHSGSSGSHNRPHITDPVGPSPSPSLPPKSTPSQAPENENESNPAFAESKPEAVSPDAELVITKTELDDILKANPDKITIRSVCIKADIPTDALKSVPLQPDESLTVILEQPDARSFSLRIYAGQREIESFHDRPIEVTVPGPAEMHQAVPQDGGRAAPVTKAENGSVTFSIPKTGNYVMDRLQEDKPEEREAKEQTSRFWLWLLAAVILGAVACTIWLVWRKRRSAQ